MSKLIKKQRGGGELILAKRHKPFETELGLLSIHFSSMFDARKSEYKVLIGADELFSLIVKAIDVHNSAGFPGGEKLKLTKFQDDK